MKVNMKYKKVFSKVNGRYNKNYNRNSSTHNCPTPTPPVPTSSLNSSVPNHTTNLSKQSVVSGSSIVKEKVRNNNVVNESATSRSTVPAMKIIVVNGIKYEKDEKNAVRLVESTVSSQSTMPTSLPHHVFASSSNGKRLRRLSTSKSHRHRHASSLKWSNVFSKSFTFHAAKSKLNLPTSSSTIIANKHIQMARARALVAKARTRFIPTSSSSIFNRTHNRYKINKLNRDNRVNNIHNKQNNKKVMNRNGNRVAIKSKFYAKSITNKSSSNKKSKPNSLCFFYCRLGRCENGDKCVFIHDKEKVAVCPRFIREGECSTTSCPFSHILEPHKMPDCLFYLQGRCNAQTCPYRHVNVSKDAKVCLEFNNGFCAKGDQCNKFHKYVECRKCLKREHKGQGKCVKCETKLVKANDDAVEMVNVVDKDEEESSHLNERSQASNSSLRRSSAIHNLLSMRLLMRQIVPNVEQQSVTSILNVNSRTCESDNADLPEFIPISISSTDSHNKVDVNEMSYEESDGKTSSETTMCDRNNTNNTSEKGKKDCNDELVVCNDNLVNLDVSGRTSRNSNNGKGKLVAKRKSKKSKESSVKYFWCEDDDDDDDNDRQQDDDEGNDDVCLSGLNALRPHIRIIPNFLAKQL